MAKPQDPANSIVTKAVAIRCGERHHYPEFQKGSEGRGVKSFAGKDRQDAHKAARIHRRSLQSADFSQTNIASSVNGG
jgi:hypothetical protein